MSKYILNQLENNIYGYHCDHQLLIPIGENNQGPRGPQGPQGPSGPSINIGDTGSGSVLVVNPDDKNNIYYNNLLKINDNIIAGTNIVPSSNNEFNLGATGARWKEIYMGPGTLNILGPQGFGNATLGSDSNGIAYTESGFATPFINIGPSELIPDAVGGWKILHNLQNPTI